MKNKTKVMAASLWLVALLVVRSDAVVIGNSSFETLGDPATPGNVTWFKLPTTGAWVDGAPASVYDILKVGGSHFATAADGSHVANLGNMIPLTQDLNHAASVGDEFTLTLSVGNSSNQADPPGNVIVTFTLDGVDASSAYEITNNAADGTWVQKSVQWTANGNGQLGLKLTSSGGGAWVDALSLVGPAGELPEVLTGAIRWDAWVGDARPYGIYGQESLSPSTWRSRVPFFTEVISANEVEINGLHQDIMDKEILYAASGGLDYFAFLLYDNDPASWGHQLSLALALYESSIYNDKLNFTVILPNPDHIVGDWQRWVDRFVAYFAKDNYQTVLGGRPLVYTFRWYPWADAAAMITQIEQACAANGIPEPYFVDQNTGNNMHASFDAITDYAISDSSRPMGTFPYADLANLTQAKWQTRVDLGLKIVPLATAGWNAQPRLDYPDYWDLAERPYYNDRYVIPTPAELAAHVEQACNFVRANPTQCEANAVLIYAWNEFGEGGWLCPGLFSEDGMVRMEHLSPVLNGSHAKGETPMGTSHAWLDGFYTTDDYVSVDIVDDDGDGVPTWREYLADTDPTNAASKLRMLGVQMTGESPRPRITWEGGTQARQILETTTDFSSWTPVQTFESPTSSAGSFDHLSASGDRQFYRIRVERP